MSPVPFAEADLPLGIDNCEVVVFDGDAVLFEESTQRLHRLNALAGAVWLLCDGQTSVASMTTELATAFSVAPDELRRGVCEVLDELAAAGLLTRS